jgi:hypothetical protein
MTAISSRGRSARRRDRADRWSDALRGAALAVVLIGVVGSVLLAKGWESTVSRQRDERLDRTAASRTVTIATALANYESALQAIGWRSVVTDDEVDEFVARTRKDQAPGFAITPPGRRPVYYVTLYSYPRLPFSDSLGADARANPGILASLGQAATPRRPP